MGHPEFSLSSRRVLTRSASAQLSQLDFLRTTSACDVHGDLLDFGASPGVFDLGDQDIITKKIWWWSVEGTVAGASSARHAL